MRNAWAKRQACLTGGKPHDIPINIEAAALLLKYCRVCLPLAVQARSTVTSLVSK